jgi:hypothetical protein
MTLIELYRSYGEDGEKGKASRDLLTQTNWFTVNAVFDPKTGEALPQALSTFLAKIARTAVDGTFHDRLWRITDHASASIDRVFRTLNESPRRDHTLLPIRTVRELDVNSFIKLSNRPGRNIREKLASKPYLHAVRRFQSIDLPENRLLKAFVTRLAELLELRKECLKEEDEMLQKIQSWLLGGEARSIAHWENLPPNNTLLSHRDYRRIWDAWRWLQTLDDDISRDLSQFEARNKTMALWLEYGQKYSVGQCLFADMPVHFDYEKFEICPWIENLVFQQINKKIDRYFTTKKISEPVCVDFTTLHPCYSAASDISQERKEYKSCTLDETYLWQHWENKNKSVDIELFNSDAVFLYPDAATISSVDLFFSKDKQNEHLDRAARAFALKLNETFKNGTLIWLVPDFLNIFELEITRRNINARFPNAEPLPRSIAAVFAQVDYSKIKNEGFTVLVVDTIGGKTCVTKLIACFDQKLSERIPETCGYYWERRPPIIISRNDPDDTEKKNYEIISVDEKGSWHDKLQSKTPQFVESAALKDDKRIGQFEFRINLSEIPVPVVGGVRLHDLKQRAGNIPLWRDHIPKLSIKVMKDGRLQPHSLVSRNTPIEPIRGKPVPIKVKDTFTLPAGKPFYKFPLLQGENDDEVGYSATLESHAFPLNTDTACCLNMTFTYGADDPYCLIFEPLNNEFSPIKAKWQKNKEEIITDALAPQYPTPLLWEDLKRWKDVQGKEVNLLEWLLDSLARWKDRIPTRSAMIISKPWKQKRNDEGEAYWFAFADTENGECYCNSKDIIDSFCENVNEAFPAGIKLFGNIQKRTNGQLYALKISKKENIALLKKTEQMLFFFREKSLQNRIPIIWADNRSLNDTNTPPEFKQEFNELITLLSNRLPQKIFMSKFLSLLSCLHKDTTDDCIKWIMQQVEGDQINYTRSIGFALGDVSQKWQKNILSKLLSSSTEKALRVFAYAIWNEQYFIEKFIITELNLILNILKVMLSQIKPCPPKRDEKDKCTVRKWVRNTAEPLELLLGLLRTRESSNPEIKMILQPYQKITKELAEQVENVTEIIAQSGIRLFSRVQLGLNKPEGDRTPDLLYALRLYLTGDDGANAIHITGVSDNDDEND